MCIRDRYVQLARTMYIEAPERAEKSIEEHREILEAIKAKDAAKAEQLEMCIRDRGNIERLTNNLSIWFQNTYCTFPF